MLSGGTCWRARSRLGGVVHQPEAVCRRAHCLKPSCHTPPPSHVPSYASTFPLPYSCPVPPGRLQDSIAEWLDGLLSGKVRTAPLQRLPEFPAPEAAAAAETAAAEEAPVEEEFDLSDIMNVSGGTGSGMGGCGVGLTAGRLAGGRACWRGWTEKTHEGFRVGGAEQRGSLLQGPSLRATLPMSHIASEPSAQRFVASMQSRGLWAARSRPACDRYPASLLPPCRCPLCASLLRCRRRLRVICPRPLARTSSKLQPG